MSGELSIATVGTIKENFLSFLWLIGILYFKNTIVQWSLYEGLKHHDIYSIPRDHVWTMHNNMRVGMMTYNQLLATALQVRRIDCLHVPQCGDTGSIPAGLHSSIRVPINKIPLHFSHHQNKADEKFRTVSILWIESVFNFRSRYRRRLIFSGRAVPSRKDVHCQRDAAVSRKDPHVDQGVTADCKNTTQDS